MRLWLIATLMVLTGGASAADFVPGIAANDASKLVEPSQVGWARSMCPRVDNLPS